MSVPYAVDRKRWAGLTIFEQMGNIYSEVGRSFNARRHHQEPDCTRATERAIDLFDATAGVLIERKSPKLKELLRAKETYLDALYGDATTEAERSSVERYFMEFAVAARLQR